jgi:hypothetical protein
LYGLQRIRFHVATAVAVSLLSVGCDAQSGPSTLSDVTHSATLTFVQRDGTCTRGVISRADATSITVEPFKQQPITIQRDSLLQVSQGNALLFSARSSWADVAHAHLYPREAFFITTKAGKRIKGTPAAVTADSITLKHGFSTTVFSKPEIALVDYLRLKPATDSFNLAPEEAPWALIFYPEFYGRAAGLEGRLPVRLYDASKPEDDRVSGVKICP